MKVTVEPFISKMDGREVRHAGIKGFADNAKVLLHRRYSPMEQKEIERQVAEALELDQVEARVPAEVPEELRKRKDEDIRDDDFDA